MSAAQRVLLVVVIALAVGIAAASLTPWQASPLVGWIAGGLWYLGSVWLKIAHLTPEETHTLSSTAGRTTADSRPSYSSSPQV